MGAYHLDVKQRWMSKIFCIYLFIILQLCLPNCIGQEAFAEIFITSKVPAAQCRFEPGAL